MYLLWFLLLLAFLLLLTYGCFRLVFYVPEKSKIGKEEFPIPPGKVYEPYRDIMIHWMKEVREIPSEPVSITSFDGLTLHGEFYEYAPGAPMELMFHGYRGNAQRDLCGGVQRAFALGHSVLLVDQRASNQSDGNVISFGINESRDCRSWVEFAINRFGRDSRIILTGISMGASTVMIAAGQKLPDNVVGVLADCGYTSAKDIIQKVMRQIHLPAGLLYPLVRLSARLFGHFDLEATSPIEAVKSCQVPVIFFHGEDDDYVPCSMSRQNYDACTAPKKLVTVPGAGHGLSFPADQQAYLKNLKEFEQQYWTATVH